MRSAVCPSRRDAMNVGVHAMNEQKIRNRNNRKRGGSFEKRGADFLDMDVVPYSGSNARFGFGDVRDSVWLGEFKNITPKDGRVTIKSSWISLNRERAFGCNRIPFLAWMPAGRSAKYIILEPDIFSKLGIAHDIDVEIPKKSCKAVNIIVGIDDNWVKSLKSDCGIVRMTFGDMTLYMMRIELFKEIIVTTGLKGTRSCI